MWPTTEHYFQAQKFAGTEYEEKIRLTNSPMIAARLGRSRIHPLRPDWENVKVKKSCARRLPRSLASTQNSERCCCPLATPNSWNTQKGMFIGVTAEMAPARTAWASS